jgi:glutamine synthetase
LGRKLAEKHMEYCLYAGINIRGLNAEIAPAQWKFQIGSLDNVKISDHLWVARYILNRLAEEFGYNISYHPKPFGFDTNWNNSGCHITFSTNMMRNNDNGLVYIYDAIHKLELSNYNTLRYLMNELIKQL